jgi:HlyD family secretion protein
MKLRLVRPLTLLLTLGTAILAGCRQEAELPVVGAADAGPRRIVALGRLEPAGGVIAISAVPGERLKRYSEGVFEGAKVKSGATLAELGSFDLRQKQLDALDAKLVLTQQQKSQQQESAKAALVQAEATLSQAQAKLEEVLSQRFGLDNLAEAAAIAAEDVRRLDQLRQNDQELVTEHQMRRRRNQSDAAQKRYESSLASYAPSVAAAEKAVAAARAGVALAETNVRFAEEIDQVAAVEMEKKVALELRDQSLLMAPEYADQSDEFTVLKTYVRPGEFVAQFPVLQLGDLRRMACVAEVYEADAKELSIGQAATIRSSAFSGQFAEGSKPGALRGKIVHIGQVVGSPALANRNPLAPSDRSIVEVRVDIDPSDEAATVQARTLVGLQTTVDFEPRSAAPAGEGGSPESP